MQTERKPIKKVVICPVCDKECDPRGLVSHIRLEHGKDKSEVKNVDKILKKAEPKKADKAKRVFELIDELKEIRKRKEELKEQDNSGWFTDDETIQSLQDGLEQLEIDIVNELEKLGLIEFEEEED